MRRPASEDSDEKDNVTIKSMFISMVRMPPRLWKLMICQVIGWVGYFATHLYFTDFMAIVNIDYFLEIIFIFSFTFKGSI
jgi:hypothetical protein